MNELKKELLTMANKIDYSSDVLPSIPDYLIMEAFRIVSMVHLNSAFGDETTNSILDTIGG